MMPMKNNIKTYDYFTITCHVSFAVSLPTMRIGKALQRNLFWKRKAENKINLKI